MWPHHLYIFFIDEVDRKSTQHRQLPWGAGGLGLEQPPRGFNQFCWIPQDQQEQCKDRIEARKGIGVRKGAFTGRGGGLPSERKSGQA